MRCRFLLVATLTVWISACGAPGLHSRARVDLNCPSAPLAERTVVDALLTGKVVAVTGCGRTQTYTQVCTDVHQCAWTR